MKKKENKLQKFLKTGILLFGISLLLWNCEKEEILDLPLKKNKIETVSIASAKELFEEFNNQKNNLFSKGRKQFNFDPLWETINQEELSFSKALLTNLEIKPSKKLNYKPKLFFININGYDIKAFETTIAEQVFNNGKIKEGTVFYHSIQGSFMTGYRIKNGKTVRILKKKPTMNKASFLSFLFPQSNFWDGLDGIEGGVFDEVVIPGPRGESMSDFMAAYNSSGEFFIDDDITGGGGDDGGGGGGNNDDTNQQKDDPCKNISKQIGNPIYYLKANELKTKTGQKKETGYKQNKDGSFTSLSDTNNGHSLTIKVDKNTMGYMHTHLNNYLTGEIDKKTGKSLIAKPIRLFSPADIIKFLQMVKNSKYNGVPMHLVYATLISSTGNYTLRFTGNIDDIINIKSVNDYNADYKRYFKKKHKNNVEKAFLHFIKDFIKVDGINLHRLRDNGDIEKKTLNNNGKVDTNDC
tara:strand:- start:197 stop:1594 length:1398 start_codon:yes stop_codon:yes gene_type:complete